MSRPACAQCLRPLTCCLCSLIPRLDSRTRLLILQHPSETRHALNTARLAALGLIQARLEIGEVFDSLAQWLDVPGYRPCVLFPDEQAITLAPYAVTDQPWLLVVPDGTWRKARKLMHMNPLLQTLPKVTLAAPAPSRYRLRKAPMTGALSTIEAIAQSLECLEPDGDFTALLRPFEQLIEGQISAMGADTFARNHAER